jgi:hypothetical protein
MEAGRATNVESPLLSGNVTEITRRDEAATAPPTTLTLASKKERAVLRGRPLRGPSCKHADPFDRPCGRPHHVMPPHRGLPGSGAGGSSSVLALCP